ncbi:DEAD/DEAH box helicase [Streptomyces subrutilus]|uniref:DEAD/DEAH box helicase n=2 Tax=Streptomyces subrutilus TaxID=36818 RepID=A0A5P2UW80_9ACTN|nr:DEAD/DEAH box helicase [Streptomyces subrutilus]QEU81781.1 DEAD/DEAH box helicase [Streptomyces subrutilus]
MLSETSGLQDLVRCSAVFLPGEPARTGRIGFWQPDGEAPRIGAGIRTTPGGGGGGGGRPPGTGPGVLFPGGAFEELTLITPDLRRTSVTAFVLPVGEALPVLTRARARAHARAPRTAPDPGQGPGDPRPATVFWGAAALLALRFTARGLLLPGLSPAGHDTWRAGPLEPADLDEIRALAAAMPPEAHCVPLAGEGPPRLPAPQPLLHAFLDAVADTLPRSPAAPVAAGGPAYADRAPRPRPALADWAAEVAAHHDAGVRISLRIEIDHAPASPGPSLAAGPPDAPHTAADTGADTDADNAADTDAVPAADALDDPGADASFRAVLQMHGLADTALVADAADVWAGAAETAAAFPPRARMDALRALRRAARLWPPLAPLLGAAVPDSVDLAPEEVSELLGAVSRELAAEGVQVHWPRGFARTLTARAVIGAPAAAAAPGSPSGLLSPGALLSLGWRHSLGDRNGDLTAAELDRLAEANRPLVRLRDRWVLVDPAEARRARARQGRELPAADALAAVLTGTAELDGRCVDVEATGALEGLRARLTADPSRDEGPEAPPALRATLRDYQLSGLRWLARMTSLGLGACLADDMGLGKTVTLIALHLHRNGPGQPATAGPTLVVCPASLLGNWQREIEKFAPGTPVRRYHGPGRSLTAPSSHTDTARPAGPLDGFVLTTYGTMRVDAPELAAVTWGMVVADEAQHVKNPRSSTAKALRTIPAPARVALTGTPVENNLSELWAVLDWTTPGLLGRLGAFRTRYAEPVESGRDPQAAARLASLVRPFLLRRRKSDPGIAPELPPKTETDHAVTLSPAQAGLYEAVVRETLASISEADGMERRGLVVKLLTSLKQVCNHPAQYTRDAAGARSGKLELLDELLDTILSEGGSVLVFTQYVAMARILEKHLAARGIAAQLLHGGTPVPRREELVDRFQAGEVPVFLLSLKAAGTGLNLTRAGHVVHYDRWWNPAVEEQATDRAYRIGQTQPVQVHRIIAEGTVEDRIARLLERKRHLADAVLAGGEAALTELTDAELAELVALHRPAAGSGA